jgi:hypothetical protein
MSKQFRNLGMKRRSFDCSRQKAVDLVALFEQQFREVGAVLPGDPGYQGATE